MTDIKWTGLDRWMDTIIVQDQPGNADHELFFPIRSLLNWSVDWLIEGGQMELIWITGMGRTVITFPTGDHGQACSDAISTLHEALYFTPERKADAAPANT